MGDYAPGRGPVLSDFYDIREDDGDCTLGAGSFATVRSGILRATGRKVAMKFIRKDLAGRSYMKNFVEEDAFTFLLKMSQEESHPNVCKQLDYMMGTKIIWNAQELLEGADLFQHLTEHAPVSEEFAQNVTSQVLKAIQHIHKVSGIGIIHRDVKLENLRFRKKSTDSELVLVDFGLSCLATPQKRRGIVGTMVYMAPEVYSTEYNTAVDLWSIGVVLFIVLTGQAPFTPDPSRGFSPEDAVSRGETVVGSLNSKELESAPPLALTLLKGLLQLDPKTRFTADEALENKWFAKESTPVTRADSNYLKAEKGRYAKTRHNTMLIPKTTLGILPHDDDDGTNPQQGKPAWCCGFPFLCGAPVQKSSCSS